MEEFRHGPVANPVKTASGKIELFSQTIADYQLDDFTPHPECQPPRAWLGAEIAHRFPLHMISIQPGDSLHNQMDATSTVQANKTSGHETLWMYPDDAASRDIVDEEVINVSNDCGRMLAGGRLTNGVSRGVVLISTRVWFDTGFGKAWLLYDWAGNPHTLALDIGTSSLTQGPNAMSCLVEIKRAGYV